MKTKFLWIAFVASAAMIAQAKAGVVTHRLECVRCRRAYFVGLTSIPIARPLRDHVNSQRQLSTSVITSRES
jgi:hypothetical protein